MLKKEVLFFSCGLASQKRIMGRRPLLNSPERSESVAWVEERSDEEVNLKSVYLKSECNTSRHRREGQFFITYKLQP